MEASKGFWGLVEIMGHQRLAGFVHDESLGGASFISVDVPAIENEAGKKREAWSKLLGAGSIYAITPMAEELARSVAKKLDMHPISEYDLPEDLRARLRAVPAIGHASANQQPYSDAELGGGDQDETDDDDDYPL